MHVSATNWNLRGSRWHRWDPHIHAPGTVRNDQFRGDWDAYFTAINNASPTIRALGITDYYSIESYRKVRAAKDAGKLTHVDLLFPNVEMRFDVGTNRGKGINLHLLFSPEEKEHEREIERLLGQLSFECRSRTFHCTRSELISLGRLCEPTMTEENAALAEGVNQFKVRFSELRELLRRESWMRENCLVAVAASSGDGTAGLQEEDSGFTLVREEIQRFADIIFSGNPSDRNFWLGLSEKAKRGDIEAKYGVLKPCLHGCDAHSLEKVGAPDLRRFCWIKGDLSFESLRQAIIEPEERICIGEQPPLPLADSVTIDCVRPLGTPWLTNEVVPFSRGIVAIIGARGSGKTALVDLIAAGADALLHPLAESSFLRRATHPADLIGGAKVEEHWRDGEKTGRNFRPPEQFPIAEPTPAVAYLSQQFVERLCSSGGLASELRREIERVIFDQIDPTERYEAESFEDLAAELLEPVRHRREQQIESVIHYSDIVSEEQRLNEQLPRLRVDRSTLAGTLIKQRKELEEIIPKGKEERVKRLLQLEAACSQAEGSVERLRRRVKALDDLLADALYVRDHAEPKRFANMVQRFAESDLSATEWEVFQQTFRGDVGATVAKAKEAAANESKRIVEGDPDIATDLTAAPLSEWPLIKLREERDKVKREVGVDAERQKKYDVLKRLISTTEAGLRKADTLIKHAEGATERRKVALQDRGSAYRAVFETFDEEKALLQKLYEPLHRQIDNAKGSLGKLRFVVKRRVDFPVWVSAGEGMLDLRMDTKFRGHGALARHAEKGLLPVWRMGDADEVATAMHEFVREFASDLQNATPASVEPDQSTEWLKQIGKWLYSALHIRIEYGLEYDGTAVEQLSPGTRGIVLLLLFLAIDRNDRRPLLIDQPEENLDPQSVQEDLVPHFREARKRRQLIIVTHNANLVVNTDAEQVIVASATPTVGGGLPTISYESGSLENPRIRHAVCDILEGGERAFLERERRYRLRWEHLREDHGAHAG